MMSVRFPRAALLAAVTGLILTGCKPPAAPGTDPDPTGTETEMAPAPGAEGQTNGQTSSSPDGDPTSSTAAADTAATPPPAPEPEPIDTNAQVALLGYHRFSESPDISRRLLPTTIYVEKFRAQMQTLVDNDIPVISMSDFLAWRRGEKNIPPFSIIITIDDGWKSTHTLALPVLKEFGFPFTVYLYAKFLNGGGKSLSFEEIADMLAAGGEIGSHSVSHTDLRKQGRRSDEMQAAFLKEETEGSRRILQEKLGIDPVTFSYPYGVYNEAVMQACVEAGYEAMVTVRGQKVGWETDLREVGRYIVHGEDDRAFDWAVSSRLPGGVAASNNILKETVVDEATGEEKPLVQVEPADDSTIVDRQPLIRADLSGVEGLDPTSLSMAISGLGQVLADYDAENQVLSYRPTQRIRLPECWVQVTFQREGEKKPDIMRWKFAIDAIANYKDLAPAQEEPQPEPQPAEPLPSGEAASASTADSPSL